MTFKKILVANHGGPAFRKQLAAALAAMFALGLSSPQPAFACSGYPARYFQGVADVVVRGRVVETPGGPAVIPRRLLKGEKKPAYRIVWHQLPYDDECAFLSAVPRKRGVYFLKRRDDGAYDVLSTEDRWKMVR